MRQQSPTSAQQTMIIGFAMMMAFTMFQLLLMLILKFVLVPDQTPTIDGFVSLISENQILQGLFAIGLFSIIVQQILKSKFLEARTPTVIHLVILLGVGELPGLLGFVSVVLAKENLSFAIPMIIMSILSFITLKSVVLSLDPKRSQ